MKPQDVLVLLKLVVLENADSKSPWKLETLRGTLFLSLSEVHAALGRARAARLLTSDRRVDRRALEEFAVHGVKYAFPASLGAPTRGVPTAHAAPAFRDLFVAGEEAQPVWPHAAGSARGASFPPLYPSATDAALLDPELYELLAALDVLRGGGRAREREAAERILRARIAHQKKD